MAKVNIAEWNSAQVAAWMKGLNGSIAPYVPLFVSRGVSGHQLLILRSDDLETIGVRAIGHQELILEAVEHLRNFHYELQRENLQQLAIRLSCVATSLHSELRLHQDSNKVPTESLSALAHVIAAVKPLVCWLDRSPFFEQLEYSDRKTLLLKIALEAATCAQRERFAEKPTFAIAAACRQLAGLADQIIQDVADPMILQPASLDTVTLKKKDNQLGFDIVPSFSGHHQIANIKFGSPAHASGKIEEGDEIVLVNYQIVVGWSPELARLACLTAAPIATGPGAGLDLVLTLRRRPGARAAALATPQLRPFRPRRPWGACGNVVNRVRFWDSRDITALRGIRVPSVEPTPEVEEQDGSSSDESEVLSPPGSPNTLDRDAHHRLYLPKPRSQVHRRNTISGSSPTSKRPNVSIEQFWRELKNQKSLHHTGSAHMSHEDDHDEISNNLYRRDKSISYSMGLELSPRPKTCLGVGLNHPIISKIRERRNDENANPTDDSKCDKNKGKLDKSHSTPAYDFDSNGNEESNSLVTQIIPESPTTPSDSPTIIIHSAEKADQILDFKKSSSQIGEAILQQQNKHKETSADTDFHEDKVKFCFPNYVKVSDSGELEAEKPEQGDKILEIINIAMMERKNKESDKTITTKDASFKTHSVYVSDAGEQSTKTISMNKHVQTIQNEIVEAINEQRYVTTMQITKVKHVLSDVPPEPPPRPMSTQKPMFKEFIPGKEKFKGKYPDIFEVKDYPPLIPVKPENIQISSPPKHITKDDIHVIPNTDICPPTIPCRKDISVTPEHKTLSYPENIPKSVLNFDNKPIQYNVMSNPDLTSKVEISNITDLPVLTQSQSLQKLQSDSRPGLIIQSPIRTEQPKVTSPTNSVVRGIIFPSTKSKSLKKKNSILAKRRKVSVKDLGPGDVQGYLHQRCRTKSNSTVVWDQKWYVLQGNTMYGFKTKESIRADCLIFLNGFTVSEAQEVKSKTSAFIVYHTGTAFYFAAENEETMKMWIDCISKATMLNYDSWERAHKKDKKVDESKHFSETDYSDDDFACDKESTDKHKNEGKEKDKSKFGSLKKFTNILHKTESHENVSHASSLDRKYLNFFSKSKHKDKDEKVKLKNVDFPVPTEQYRSYRKVSSNQSTQMKPSISFTKICDDTIEEAKISPNVAKIKKIDNKLSTEIDTLLSVPKSQKIPKPVNYAHASNPNLFDFDKNDMMPKPFMNIPFTTFKIQHPDMIGSVTLEQFMLKKQEEERRQVYSNRVLMGIERDSRKDDNGAISSSSSKKLAQELQEQWKNIIPDVIYGELPKEEDMIPVSVEQIQNRSLPKTPEKPQPAEVIKKIEQGNSEDKAANSAKINDTTKPISIKGKDGYEKIVYPLPEDDKKVETISLTIKTPMVTKDEPPKIFPRKPSLAIPDDLKKQKMSPEIPIKSSTATAKDLGYETIYGTDKPLEKLTITPNIPTSFSAGELGELRVFPRTMPEEGRKPIPPPKIMPKSKQVLNRQSSLTANANRNSGPDMNPVFIHGESPQKFWLDSLRRNDKVHNNKAQAENVSKPEKFYTKRSEPSAFLKSSEATIVKSDRLNKNMDNFGCKSSGMKPLKSATQYTPMSLPLNANNSLKTSPKFEMTLDSRDPPPPSGISRLRQIFQGGQSSGKQRPSTPSPTGSVKEKTILGSPRLHRTIFKKHHNTPQPGEDFCQEFTYTKGPTASSSDSYSSPDSQVTSDSLVEEMTIRSLATPDYPHLECPPTFEPEIYSLSDPTASLNLLRKKNNESK